jgi:hypothetical protein
MQMNFRGAFCRQMWILILTMNLLFCRQDTVIKLPLFL